MPPLPVPTVPLPDLAYLKAKRREYGLPEPATSILDLTEDDSVGAPTAEPAEPAATEATAAILLTLDLARKSSFEAMTLVAERAEGERIVGLVRHLSSLEEMDVEPFLVELPPSSETATPAAAPAASAPSAADPEPTLFRRPPATPPMPSTAMAPPPSEPPPLAAPASEPQIAEAPPTLQSDESAKSVAVRLAQGLLDDFEWQKAHEVLPQSQTQDCQWLP